jgi:hypothetical protein
MASTEVRHGVPDQVAIDREPVQRRSTCSYVVPWLLSLHSPVTNFWSDSIWRERL